MLVKSTLFKVQEFDHYHRLVLTQKKKKNYAIYIRRS